jgi:hypothetical protein
VRILLVALLTFGVAGLAVLPERTALLVALLVLLLAFLTAGAMLAIDLIELSASELGADATALVAAGIGLTQITSANRVMIGSLLALALLAQAVALALWRRPERVG